MALGPLRIAWRKIARSKQAFPIACSEVAVKRSARVTSNLPSWLLLTASIAGAVGAIWQRLLFERLLPLPGRALVAVFWLLLLVSLAIHHASGAAPKRAAAWLVLIAALVHLWFVGWPTFVQGVELEEYRWRLAGHLSTAYYGLPFNALLTMAGVLAWAWLSTQTVKLPVLARVAAVLALLFGATTVLGYATGSAWPFGV